jgi:hypothetical protein
MPALEGGAIVAHFPWRMVAILQGASKGGYHVAQLSQLNCPASQLFQQRYCFKKALLFLLIGCLSKRSHEPTAWLEVLLRIFPSCSKVWDLPTETSQRFKRLNWIKDSGEGQFFVVAHWHMHLYGNLTLGICFSMFFLCCWGSFSEVPPQDKACVNKGSDGHRKAWLLQFCLCDMAGQMCVARVAGSGLWHKFQYSVQ